MKTYCKRMDLSDIDFITNAVAGYMYDKLDNRNMPSIFAYYNGCSNNQARKAIESDTKFVESTIDMIAYDMSWHIKTRTVREHVYMVVPQERLVKNVGIIDGMSGKHRVLGLEKMIFQLYEVLLRDAAEELFRAKVGLFQVASIKGKGQTFGKKHLERWLSRDPEGTKYCAKADISKCYPSMKHSFIQKMLHRDLGKSPDLLYVFDTIFTLYREAKEQNNEENTDCGIFIGSPVSKDLCNYYMSKLYHYAEQQLFITKTRRGKEKRTRLISHIMIYMDDITIFGSNKRNVHMAMRMIIEFCRKEMHLTIKDNWRKFLTSCRLKSGKRIGSDLDFMGYVFCGYEISYRQYGNRTVKLKRVRTKVRASIFLKARKKFHRFKRKIKEKVIASKKYAMSTLSYHGWIKNSDNFGFRSREKWDQVMAMAANIVSRYAKGKGYSAEKYHKKWRKMYA